MYQSRLLEVNFIRSRNGDVYSIQNINPYFYHEHEWEDSINPTSSETVVLYYYVLSVRTYIVNESASRNITP